jgi:hypothetical protein
LSAASFIQSGSASASAFGATGAAGTRVELFFLRVIGSSIAHGSCGLGDRPESLGGAAAGGCGADGCGAGGCGASACGAVGCGEGAVGDGAEAPAA